MKKSLFILLLFGLSTYSMSAQTILEFESSQSMSITGKGPGQDAAINPYFGSNSFGIIENIGKNDLVIRIQKEGKVLELITVKPKETEKVELLKGYELYLDSKKKSKAKISFSKS
ncbi:hypothetical protein [Psychroserpens sp. Hel_I_66]|uniref:hypothetical protein n=1 Tax=Psychroserpens sp. Hel_I_66 TaxID=1250004 RepID=UPI0018CE82DE|nr:hypothetical protein [Psychroserpens sp. Hel_I_66]